MTAPAFPTVLCAVGGARGGLVVPRWFGTLAALGAEHVCLFWAMPPGPEAEPALDALRSEAKRWLAEIRALGPSGELVIKRGQPGPWITALARICRADLVVLGPPSVRGGGSATIAHVLDRSVTPLLLLPDDGQPPERDLLARPLADPGGTEEARALVRRWTDGRPTITLADAPRGADERESARDAVRRALEADASVLVLAGRAPRLAPYALEFGSIPLLIAPAQPRASHGASPA